MRVSSNGPAWEEFLLEDNSTPDPTVDVKYALYAGRCLAFELLHHQYWKFLPGVDVEIEWETDGKIVESKRMRSPGRFEESCDAEDSD